MAGNQQGAGSNRGGGGNVADNPQRASEAGKKGGEHSHGHQASGNQPATRQQGSGESGGYNDGRIKSPDIVEKGATG
jgi:general stress protein YciG